MQLGTGTRRGALTVVAVLAFGGLAPAAGGAPADDRGADLPPRAFQVRGPLARQATAAAPAATSKQPERGSGHVPAARVVSDYVDTCTDVVAGTDAFDVRRGYVDIAPGGTARFSVAFCGAPDLGAFGARVLRWQTYAEQTGVQRVIELDRDGGAWQVTVYDGDGDAMGPPTTSGGVLTTAQSGRPVDELYADVSASQLGLAPQCESSATGCLTFLIASFGTGSSSDPGDIAPNPEAVSPTMAWPSPCSSSQVTADNRATVRVERGRGADLAARVRAAGYPAVSHDDLDLVEITQGVGDDVLAALRRLDGVVGADRPTLRQRAELVPDDDRYPEQWYLDRLGLPAAWDLTRGSPTVRVGVLDDGIDGTRQELVGRVAAGYDAVNDRTIPAAANSDLGAHGTAVAGFAAATGNDDHGLAGVDWRAAIVPIRVMDHEQCITDASYLSGLQWAADHGGLDVLNVSLGGAEILSDGNHRSERELVAGLDARDTVVVAATGNQGDRGFAPSFPAAIAEVIGVGATGPGDQVTAYSNRGTHVDVVAPGGDDSGSPARDLLALADPTLDGDDYAPLAGTSFSTPLVAGLAALYRARHPDSSVADVTRALLNSTRDLGDALAGFDVAHGFGMPVAARMLQHEPGGLTARLQGADRFATAVAATRRAFPDGALVSTVLLSTGVDFPDALAGSPLAARLHAPLLLATPSGVPGVTMAELERLSPERVLLLGGNAALGPAVDAQLTAAGYTVQRISGTDRYDTAARVATGEPDGTPSPWTPWPSSDLVYLATGAAFPDALAGGAVAAAFGAPLLLTPRTGLAGATDAALRHLAPSVVVILGGDAAVSAEVERQVQALPSNPQVIRAEGPDRFATAVAAQCPHRVVCIPDTRYALVATGTDFADALSGGAAAAALRAPLLLVPPGGQVPGGVLQELSEVAPEQALVLGGEAAVAPSVEVTVASRVTP